MNGKGINLGDSVRIEIVEAEDFPGMDFGGMSAVVAVWGIPAFEVYNDGWGGPDFNWPIGNKGEILYQRAKTYVESLTYISMFDGETMQMCMDVFIGELLDKWFEARL